MRELFGGDIANVVPYLISHRCCVERKGARKVFVRKFFQFGDIYEMVVLFQKSFAYIFHIVADEGVERLVVFRFHVYYVVSVEQRRQLVVARRDGVRQQLRTWFRPFLLFHIFLTAFPFVLIPFLYFLHANLYTEINKNGKSYRQQYGQQQSVKYCRPDNLFASFLSHALLLRLFFFWCGRILLFPCIAV